MQYTLSQLRAYLGRVPQEVNRIRATLLRMVKYLKNLIAQKKSRAGARDK